MFDDDLYVFIWINHHSTVISTMISTMISGEMSVARWHLRTLHGRQLRQVAAEREAQWLRALPWTHWR